MASTHPGGLFAERGAEADVASLLVSAVCVCVSKLCLNLCELMDCSLPGSSVHGDSPGKNTAIPFSRGIFPTPGIESRSSTLWADSLPSEPPGKTLLHCRNTSS